MPNNFFNQDILTADQFSQKDLQTIITVAKKMKKMVEKKGASDLLHGKLMTALFYEPSSRTFGSFIAAMQRLGGGLIPLQGVSYSSVSKGETLADTVRTFASYTDIVVIRHPEIGSAKIAAEFCDKPVINAGDGVGEHPTQALLDLFTITDHFGSLDGINVTMVGDLLNGRTVHSLSKLVALHKNVTINLISPEMLQLPTHLKEKLTAKGAVINEYEKLDQVLGKTDVLYVTRVQKERFTDLELYEKLKHHYIITPTVLKKASKSMIVMHPLPRVGEITADVDLDPRAVYLTEQMSNGMYVRMALLALILNKDV